MFLREKKAVSHGVIMFLLNIETIFYSFKLCSDLGKLCLLVKRRVKQLKVIGLWLMDTWNLKMSF